MQLARIKVIAKLLLFFGIYCVWVLIALGISLYILPIDKVAPLTILLYLFLIMTPIWLMGKFQNRTPGWIKRVQDEGKDATATIIKVGDTGITINNRVVVILVQMRVEPLAGGEPFEIILEKNISILSGFGDFYEGAKFKVKYDPNNKKHVVFMKDFSTSNYSHGSTSTNYESQNTGHGGENIEKQLGKLSNLHKSGELSDAEFEQAKKKILNN